MLEPAARHRNSVLGEDRSPNSGDGSTTSHSYRSTRNRRCHPIGGQRIHPPVGPAGGQTAELRRVIVIRRRKRSDANQPGPGMRERCNTRRHRKHDGHPPNPIPNPSHLLQQPTRGAPWRTPRGFTSTANGPTRSAPTRSTSSTLRQKRSSPPSRWATRRRSTAPSWPPAERSTVTGRQHVPTGLRYWIG